MYQSNWSCQHFVKAVLVWKSSSNVFPSFLKRILKKTKCGNCSAHFLWGAKLLLVLKKAAADLQGECNGYQGTQKRAPHISWWSSSRFCKKISGFTKSNGDKLILWPCFGGNCLISSSFVKRCRTGDAPEKRNPPQSTRAGAPLAHPCPCWFLAQKVNTLTLSQTDCFQLNWTIVFST